MAQLRSTGEHCTWMLCTKLAGKTRSQALRLAVVLQQAILAGSVRNF